MSRKSGNAAISCSIRHDVVKLLFLSFCALSKWWNHSKRDSCLSFNLNHQKLKKKMFYYLINVFPFFPFSFAGTWVEDFGTLLPIKKFTLFGIFRVSMDRMNVRRRYFPRFLYVLKIPKYWKQKRIFLMKIPNTALQWPNNSRWSEKHNNRIEFHEENEGTKRNSWFGN